MKTANRLLARNHRHGLWRAVCVALAILLLTSTAFAAQLLTGTFKGKVIGAYVTFTNPVNNRVVTDWSGVLSLQLDRDKPGDGLGPLVPVFCIEVNVLVRGGDRYESDGPVTELEGGCAIRYLLDKYPAATATTGDEAAARQLAIWHFSDKVDLTSVQEAAIRARAIALADEAALAVALGGCPGTQATAASLTLTPPTASVVAGQVINYTVQADPPGAAQNVEITISGSATLQNGLQQATLPLVQGAATFSVINPVAGTSTITARLPYVLDAGTVFSPIGGRKTQRLVMADRISLSASATVQASWGAATATPTATSAPPTETPSTGGTPTSTPFSNASPTATPSSGDTPTSTPFNNTSPTATPFGSGSSTSTPSTGGSPTATPFGSGSSTSTPSTDGSPTATPFGGGSSTATPIIPSPPGEAPSPPTPTRKPSSGPKPPSTPEATPESATPGGSGSPPSGTPVSGGTGPTPGGGGENGGSGGSGDSSAGGASSGAGGTNSVNQIRPSQLPNTGESGSAAPVAFTVAGLLIMCGVWLRKRSQWRR